MPEISFKLKPSKQFNLLILLVLSICLVIVASINLRWEAKLALAVSVLIYSGWIAGRYGLLISKQAIVKLVLNSNGWAIGKAQSLDLAQVCGDSTVTTWVSVLRFKVAKKRAKQTCVIFRDSLGSEQYRRLLVALRTVK